METNRRIEEWLAAPLDHEMRQEIERLKTANPLELQDAFSSLLLFGTGGIRERVGVGIGRFNIYTVRMAAKALSLHLKECYPHSSVSVLIGYDSRLHSKSFALESARVLAADQIAVYLTEEMRPTPFISFACRHLKCRAGIMITASHNPPEYNGFKVYWDDGAQVVAPHDQAIIEKFKKIDPFSVSLAPLHDAHIHKIGDELDAHYLEAIAPLQKCPYDNHTKGHLLKIVYSPLHGTGLTLTPKALQSWGFTSLSLVAKQATPDGHFPFAPRPNPEEHETLKLGIEQMIQEQADLFLANDPDADRIGVSLLHAGKPVTLDGHEMAVIGLYHTLSQLTCSKQLPHHAACCTTIVTTNLFGKIAKNFHVHCYQVLTGFKFIGEKIREWELDPQHGYHFLFGAEESQGYLLGMHARDKDGVVALCLMAEIALQMKKEGLTLVDYLHDIYSRFGVHRGKNVSLAFEASEAGHKQMSQLMQHLRHSKPDHFFDQKVVIIEDYLTQKRHFMAEGTEEIIDLPQSNVITFKLSDGSEIIFRPSGTEPKIKIYAMLSYPPSDAIETSIENANRELDRRLTQLKAELHAHLSN